jgi:uncharacterized RDD family membrane protein YckC
MLCPLCGKNVHLKCEKKLYDKTVCRKCFYAFTNRRQLAYLIDLIVFNFVFARVIGLIFSFIPGLTQDQGQSLLYLLALMAILLFNFKDCVFGQSLGKAICGVRVISELTGMPAGILDSFARNLPLAVPFMPFVISFQMGKGHRTGDDWSKTRVVWKKYATNPVFAVTPFPASNNALVPQTTSIASKALLFSGIGCGGIAILLFAFLFVAAMIGGDNGNSPPVPSPSNQKIEAQISEALQTGFDKEKQKIFDYIHPTGTAKSIKLHDVTVIEWKRGQVSGRLEDVVQFTVRYTLYWQGPITTDGFTKITQTFDNETQRYVGGKILETNGTTNQDVSYALGYIGGMLLYDALNK